MIAITGAGCVLPTGVGTEVFWRAASLGESAISAIQIRNFSSNCIKSFGHVSPEIQTECWQLVPRHLQRYATPEVSWGLHAVQQALIDARINTDDKNNRFGLYSCQGGYTYPSIKTYAELLDECNGASGLDIKKLTQRILRDRALDPFLVIKSLTNGLLGIVSLALKIEAECGAYMEGVSGNYAALQQATEALLEKRIDVAIVVGAGSELDPFGLSELVRCGAISAQGVTRFKPYDQSGKGGVAGEGAVAFVLQRSDDCYDKPSVHLSALSSDFSVDSLDISNKHFDMLVCNGTGTPSRDQQRCDHLKNIPAKNVTTSQSLTGVLSAAPCLTDILLTRCAMYAELVPPVSGLTHPVNRDVKFVMNQPASLPISNAAIIAMDHSGFIASYELQYRNSI